MFITGLIVRRNVVCGADLHVAEVVKIGERKHSGKLLAQSRLHGRLHRVNPILGKSARFDIPIEDENLMPRQGYLLCGEQTGGTAPTTNTLFKSSSYSGSTIAVPRRADLALHAES